MSQERDQHPAVQVVQAYIAALHTAGTDAARAYWADDAVWHITGSHEFAGDYGPDSYLALLARLLEEYPSYSAELREMIGFGDELAVLMLESSGGAASSQAPGVAIFRVVGARIVEGWAIPAFASGRQWF